MRTTTKRRLVAVLSTMALLVGSLVTMGAAQSHNANQAKQGQGNQGQDSEHCDDHNNPDYWKVQAEDSPQTITVDGQQVVVTITGDTVTFTDPQGNPVAVDFCMKASTGQSGPRSGSSGTVDWTNRGGQTPDISYVVVYGLADDCPHSLTLSPPSDTNEVGDTHTVTATVTNSANQPCVGVSVRFDVSPAEGANPPTGTGTTNQQGQASFSYTRNAPSSDTITACTDSGGNAPAQCDTTQHVYGQATKEWVEPPPGCPHSLTLTPPSDTNDVGDLHTVTATVTDGQGNACEGVSVRFEVSPAAGAEPPTGTVSTNQQGQASFSYTRNAPGSDTITACTDSDGNAPAQCDTTQHIYAQASKQWVEPPAGELRCWANLLGVILGGNALPNLFEANPDHPGRPCATDHQGLLVLLAPLLGDGGLGLLNDDSQIELSDPSGNVDGFIIVDAAWARTDRHSDTHGSATSGVLWVQINDGNGDRIIIEALTSSSETTCGQPTINEARVVRVIVDGEEIEIPDEYTFLIADDLMDLIHIHLKAEDGQGPGGAGSKALAAGALLDNVIAVVAHSDTGCD